MLICGDMAVPTAECAERLMEDIKNCHIFEDQDVLTNPEGTILKTVPRNAAGKAYNCESVIGL